MDISDLTMEQIQMLVDGQREKIEMYENFLTATRDGEEVPYYISTVDMTEEMLKSEAGCVLIFASLCPSCVRNSTTAKYSC